MWIFIILLVFSIFSMNFPLSTSGVDRPSVLGPQRYGLFRNLQIFSQLFWKNFSFQNFEELSPSPLSFAGCKGRHYFLFCKLFWPLFWRFFTLKPSTILTSGCCIVKDFLESHFRICREKDLPLKVICKIARIAERWIRKLL